MAKKMKGGIRKTALFRLGMTSTVTCAERDTIAMGMFPFPWGTERRVAGFRTKNKVSAHLSFPVFFFAILRKRNKIVRMRRKRAY